MWNFEKVCPHPGIDIELKLSRSKVLENKFTIIGTNGTLWLEKDDFEFAKRTLTKLKTPYDVQYYLHFAGKADKAEVAQKLIALK